MTSCHLPAPLIASMTPVMAPASLNAGMTTETEDVEANQTLVQVA
jgi:hypothetical protein